MAGHCLTAEACVLCSFMISVHPAVEAKVLAELQALQLMPSAAQPQPRSMNYDDIAKLTYTGNAIKVKLCHPCSPCPPAVHQRRVAGSAELPNSASCPFEQMQGAPGNEELLCMVLA